MTPVIDPEWNPALLAGGAMLVKGMMGALDKGGALDKLPPWLRPQVTAAGSAVVGFLAALSAGVDAPTAAMGAFAVLGVSHHAHATVRGLAKTRTWKARKKGEILE